MTLTSVAGAPRASGNLRMTPGRWVAVALAVPVAIALIGWTGFSLVNMFARGSYPFSYAVPVHDGQVSVHVEEGSVTLRQVPGGSARVAGTVQYGLIRPGITESSSAGGINVGINCDGLATDCGLSAVLGVPARTGVTLWSGGGDIGVSGFASSLTLWAQGGNMTASNLVGNLRLDTGGGDLTASALDAPACQPGGCLAPAANVQISTEGGNVDASNLGNVSSFLRLDTGGGDVTGNGFSGQVQLLTAGGNINLNFLASSQFNANSGGGDVSLAFTQMPVNVQVTADGGNVTLILPPGAKYDILTPGLDGGNVSYPGSLASSASPRKITVNSGGGDVTIMQAN
jgi:Putative adhesin